MPVMREKQGLCLTGQLPKDFKPRRSAGIIEIDNKSSATNGRAFARSR
jgi:hypothetical protein